MIRLYSPARTEKVIRGMDGMIARVSSDYDVPAAAIRAVLYREIKEIDLMDLAADAAVRIGVFGRRDSSTGYMQIFGWVGLNAVNFAVDEGLATYESLGLCVDHRLDPQNRADVRRIWKKMQTDRTANLEIAALNLISCAKEMTGRIDFAHYTEEEWKLLFTRYNQNTRKVTPYGEETYAHYVRYLKGGTPNE